jgi:hypothetical protein
MNEKDFNCPYGMAQTCEHAQPGSVRGEFVPCIHLHECLDSNIAKTKEEKKDEPDS